MTQNTNNNDPYMTIDQAFNQDSRHTILKKRPLNTTEDPSSDNIRVDDPNISNGNFDKKRRLDNFGNDDVNDSDGLSETLQEIDSYLQNEATEETETNTIESNRDSIQPVSTSVDIVSSGVEGSSAPTDQSSGFVLDIIDMDSDSEDHEEGTIIPSNIESGSAVSDVFQSAHSSSSNINRPTTSSTSRRRTVSFNNDVDVIDPSRTVVHFTENPAEIIPRTEIEIPAVFSESEDEEIQRPRTPTLVHFEETPTVIPNEMTSEVIDVEGELSDHDILVISSDEESEIEDNNSDDKNNEDDVEIDAGWAKRMSIEDQLANNKPGNISKLSSAQCSICLDSPQNAVFLPCGHIFCNQCAFKSVSTTKQSNKTSGPCPLCRHSTNYRSIKRAIFKKKKKFLGD